MTRRPTFSELAWPDGADDSAQAQQWATGITTQVLDWTWRAYDLLQAKHFSGIDFRQSLEQLERDLVRHHFVEIQRLFAADTDGFASFVPHHEWPEMQSRSTASAKPPANDLAFVSVTNQRWAWAIEAKVVPSSGSLATYLNDVNEKFVTGIASPVIGEGGMLGYLLDDDVAGAFKNLQERLGQGLEQLADFEHRPHRTSNHNRSAAPDLRLHHMLMVCVT